MESGQINDLDADILRLLMKNSRMPLGEISSRLKTSKSTVHYRIKRLEEEGTLEGYYAKVNPEKLGLDFTAILSIRVKYGTRYRESVGEFLAKLPGVIGVYFLFGETDFLVIMRSHNSQDLFGKLEKLYSMQEIERTSTVIVAKTVKEDPRLQI